MPTATKPKPRTSRTSTREGAYTWEAEKFFELLADTGTVKDAADGLGIAHTTVYRRKKTDPDFAAAWEAHEEALTEKLEDVAYTRAIEGKSDRLIEFLLKARRPDKYRERVEIDDKRRSRAEKEKLSEEDLDRELTGFDELAARRAA